MRPRRRVRSFQIFISETYPLDIHTAKFSYLTPLNLVLAVKPPNWIIKFNVNTLVVRSRNKTFYWHNSGTFFCFGWLFHKKWSWGHLVFLDDIKIGTFLRWFFDFKKSNIKTHTCLVYIVQHVTGTSKFFFEGDLGFPKSIFNIMIMSKYL